MRRLVAVLGLAAVTLGLLTSTASAEPVVVSDPAGESPGATDIRAFQLVQNEATVRLQIRTQRGLDLSAAPTWTSPSSITQLRFNLDTKGDRKVDYVVILDPNESGGPEVTVEGIAQSPAPRIVCATVSQPQLTIIRVRVALACLGDPPHVRGFTRYQYDRGANGTLDGVDRGPNGGYTPFLPLPD
jgi:hypothetical protein